MKTITQTAQFNAPPHEIYELLMDSKKHAAFTGDSARISRKAGGKFSTFGGYATGENILLIADKKIVQSWRASDWPKGAESVITFSLAKTKAGTKLSFTQKGVPDEHAKSIAQGWKEFYWQPMKAWLAENR